MANKPSSGEVLRALAEEVRERGAHPDREDVLTRYLDDDQDEQKDNRERDGSTADDSTQQNPDSETDREGPENRPGEDKTDTTAPESGKPSTRKAGK